VLEIYHVDLAVLVFGTTKAKGILSNLTVP